jgi:hypothetical protein
MGELRTRGQGRKGGTNPRSGWRTWFTTTLVLENTGGEDVGPQGSGLSLHSAATLL